MTRYVMKCIRYFRKFNVYDFSIATYFLGILVAGILGVLDASHVEETLILESIPQVLFSASMFVCGAAGFMASLFKSKKGELVGVIMVACLTVIQGAGLWEDKQTSIRLLIAPFMMIPFAMMRRGFTISKRDVDRIKTRLPMMETGDE